LRVERILRHQRELDLLLELGDLRLERRDLLLRELPHVLVGGGGEQLLRLLQRDEGLLVVAVEAHHGLELGALLRELLELAVIVRDLGRAQALLELAEARDDLVELGDDARVEGFHHMRATIWRTSVTKRGPASAAAFTTSSWVTSAIPSPVAMSVTHEMPRISRMPSWRATITSGTVD